MVLSTSPTFRPATAICAMDRSSADDTKEFDTEIAAPSTDTNMHRDKGSPIKECE